jgi:hypothetical protein
MNVWEVGLRELYNLHNPFVILFLAFVLVFVWAGARGEKRQ